MGSYNGISFQLYDCYIDYGKSLCEMYLHTCTGIHVLLIVIDLILFSPALVRALRVLIGSRESARGER